MDKFIRDLRFALRLWRKQPLMFLSGVAALTLGIGLVTFSLCAIDCIFFGKLPFPDSDRIVYTTIHAPDLRSFQERQSTFEALSVFRSSSVNFKAIDAPVRRDICSVSPNFLEVVHVTPLFGRAFLPGEGRPGSEPVALIGYDLWQREFHGNASAIGAVCRLDGQPRTIVGIMPEGFKFPIADEIWIPMDESAATMPGWGFVFGRLKTSATVAEARAELNLIADSLSVSAGQSQSPARPPILVGPFTRYMPDTKGSFGPKASLFALLAVTSLVLFIACANVAGLSLASAAKRGTELAVRGALGATRTGLVAQMLIESLILALCGAVGSSLIIAALGKWFSSYLVSHDAGFGQLPFWMRFQIDGRILLALIVLVLLTNLLAGLWPALQATKRNMNEFLEAGRGGISTIHSGRFRWLLVTVQIAFSVVVLTQSFALLGFSRQLKQVHLPFDASATMAARVSLPSSTNAVWFFHQFEQNLAGLSGVESVALSTSDPTSGKGLAQLAIEGIDYPRPEYRPFVPNEVVSDRYFQTLNLPLLQGRGFNPDDVDGSLPVAVVNSTFAKEFFPSGDLLGHRFREGTNDWLTIIGCVQDLNYEPLTSNPKAVYFLPISQRPPTSMVVMLRGRGHTADWTKTLSAEVSRLQPDLAVYHVANMQTLVNHQIIGYYMAGWLLGICGTASLFLATLGIFGLITFSINQRTREIGVRLALGASRRKIILTLLKQSLWQIATGLAVGSLFAFTLNQILSHTIQGYPTIQYLALVFLAAVLFLGAISLVAVLIPAIRGARVEPMVALRYQ